MSHIYSKKMEVRTEGKFLFDELFSSPYLQERLLTHAPGRLLIELANEVEKYKTYDENGDRRNKPLKIQVRTEEEIKKRKWEELIQQLTQESEGSVWLLSKNLITEEMGTKPFKVFYNLDSCLKFCDFFYEDWHHSTFSFMDGYHDGYFKKVVRIDKEYYTYVAKFVKAE